MRRTSCERDGTIIIALMVFLGVASMIIVGWMKLAGMERRQLRSVQARDQAEWLAESALSRAAARLRADREYTGETWKLSAEDMGGRDGGEVVIRVEPIDGNKMRREVRVRADYPVDPLRRQRRTKSIQVSTEAEGDS